MCDPLHVAVNECINYIITFIFHKQHCSAKSEEITPFTMIAVAGSIARERTVTTILTLVCRRVIETRPNI